MHSELDLCSCFDIILNCESILLGDILSKKIFGQTVIFSIS